MAYFYDKIPQHQFQRDRVKLKSEKYLNQLESQTGYNPDLEIIPYEDLWSMILVVMDKLFRIRVKSKLVTIITVAQGKQFNDNPTLLHYSKEVCQLLIGNKEESDTPPLLVNLLTIELIPE